jgi:hypothetical protein
MGQFYRGLLNWFAADFYPFKYKVIGTYDKAVEFWNKKLEFGREIEKNILPSITLDPSGEFEPEERAGKFFWQYPNLGAGLGARLFDPIYKDEQIRVTPVFTRFQGTAEIMMWCHSVYEYIDVRTKLFMWSGGIGRYLRPRFWWTYIVLPDEVLDYEYEGSQSVQKYQIDWRSTDAVLTLIRNMNQTRTVYPLKISPWFQIESVGDGSQKYGGQDLASYKLLCNIKYEINLPTYLVVEADWKLNTIKIDTCMGGMYTSYGDEPPVAVLERLTYNEDKPEYDDVRKLRIFETDFLADQTCVIVVENITCSPDKSTIINWNPIVSGPLRIINTATDWANVEVGDIVYSSIFRDEYLPQMRISKAIISNSPNLDYIKRKCELMNKTLFYGLDSTQVTRLQIFDQQIITLDPYKQKIYLDVVASKEIFNDVPGWGYDVLADLKSKYPEDFIGKRPGNIVYDSTYDIYTKTYSDDELIPFQQRVIYEFDMDSTSPIFIPLVYEINSNEELIMLSYPGRLEPDVHYILHADIQEVELLIPPKEDEIVEMFYYCRDPEGKKRIPLGGILS